MPYKIANIPPQTHVFIHASRIAATQGGASVTITGISGCNWQRYKQIIRAFADDMNWRLCLLTISLGQMRQTQVRELCPKPDEGKYSLRLVLEHLLPRKRAVYCEDNNYKVGCGWSIHGIKPLFSRCKQSVFPGKQPRLAKSSLEVIAGLQCKQRLYTENKQIPPYRN